MLTQNNTNCDKKNRYVFRICIFGTNYTNGYIMSYYNDDRQITILERL
jgi:hypothetical protein